MNPITYFKLYETKHYGWQAEIIDSEEAEDIIENEDNNEIYVCYTRDFIWWTDLISVTFAESFAWNLKSFEENKVSTHIIGDELWITD